MKKIVTFFLCLLLVTVSTATVFATNSVQMSFQASGTTVHRGDTVTITVSISAIDDCRSAGFAHSFDANVFEFVSGSCTLPGVAMGSVNSSAASFAYGSGASVSGQIFTYTLKVKDNAPYGTYSVSGTANVRDTNGSISASVSSAMITVACNHSYGDWVNESASRHQKACSKCGDVQTASHTWNSGTVTKQPSCKETGIKTFSCTGCNAAKTETISKTSNHSYGAWTAVNDSMHQSKCSVCSDEKTSGHNWNSGTVTKLPTCKDAGIKTYTCTDCKHTKTEAVDKTNNHSYGSWINVNDATHKHTCTTCKIEESSSHNWNGGTVAKQPNCMDTGIIIYTCTVCGGTKSATIAKLTTHTYDHACDTDCNICGTVRTATHSYKSKWSTSKNEHWHECSVCRDKKDVATHTPGEEANETKAQTCTTCGYVIRAALGHAHSYENTFTTDEQGHWYKCSGCEEMGSYADHDFENTCDKDCSICGYSREADHVYADSWKINESTHWRECTSCGQEVEKEPHIPGDIPTETAPQICTICGYAISPATGNSEPVTEPTGTTATEPQPIGDTHPSVEDSPDTYFLWWLLISIGIVGGIVVVINIVRNKRKN